MTDRITAWHDEGTVRFGLLGPLQVVDGDGITRPVPAAKQRVVLAALLLADGTAISAGSMSEALWDMAPPANAPSVMRTYLARLRRTLGPVGARLAGRPSGWAITLHGPEELDIAQVEHLWRIARIAGESGDAKRASSLLTEALGYWRGEPLADVPSTVLASRDGTRLGDLRLQLTEARIDADLRLGRHAELVPELRRLAAEHPLREHIRVQLMLACYRCGQQAAALDVYQDAHRTLAAELGVAPGPELQDVHRRVLAADPGLSTAPAGATTPPGLAPRSAAGTASSPAVVPRQIPAGIRQFVGRAAELSALSALLYGTEDAGAAVVISAVGGAAGVGKTALAIHWAHKVADRFPDGQLYADLRGRGPSADPVPAADVLTRFLDALGVPADQVPSDTGARQDLYRSLLASKRTLIVLDNARDAAQVRPLLPGGRSCAVLVTSRSQLASLVAAEGAHPLPLDVLTAAEARQLLTLRLGRDRVAAEPDAAAELVELCARLPLALAIAASRAALRPSMPIAALASELRDAGGRLAVLDAGEGVSVQAVFSWSYQHLPDPARRMFRLLGLHPGPDISVAAATSLAGTGPGQARALLGQLTEASLLTEHVPGRFRFHDLLRGYAAQRAQAEDGQRAAIQRTADHYLHSARAADLVLRKRPAKISPAPAVPGVTPERPDDYRQALAWFESERHVLTAVVEQAISTGLDTHGWQLPLVLVGFYDRTGHNGSSLAIQRAALGAAQRLDDLEAQAQIQHSLGTTCLRMGALEDAEHHHQQEAHLCEKLGDQAGQAHAHLGLCTKHDIQGRYREALSHASIAVALSQSTDDQLIKAAALNNLGWSHTRLGDYQQALLYCRQAIGMLREAGEAGDQFLEAHAWDSLGYTHHQLAQHAEAVSSYEQALALFRLVGDRFYEAVILDHLGDALRADGEPELARQAWEKSATVLEERCHQHARKVRGKLQQLM